MCHIRQTVIVDQLSLYLTKCLEPLVNVFRFLYSFEPCDMLIGVDLNKMPPDGHLIEICTRSFH